MSFAQLRARWLKADIPRLSKCLRGSALISLDLTSSLSFSQDASGLSYWKGIHAGSYT
jgi:hypothetical protein